MRFVSVSFVILASMYSAFAQGPSPYSCSGDKLASDQNFRTWVKQDVAAIISDREAQAFAKLTRFEDKMTFVEAFWLRRDPDPDTQVNEYKEEFCDRIKKTDSFASGIQGWRTDRGRIVIWFGEPDRIESGAADLEGFPGVKFERWTFDHVLGIGEKIEITFVDPTESNEYRFLKS